MYRDRSRYKMFTRRALMLSGGQAVLLSALATRMYYLQVIESARYQVLAEENRINLRLLLPSRGRIVDRFGVELAVNEKSYRVVIVSEQTKDVEETLDKLGAIISLSDYERRRVRHEIKRRRGFFPITVRENLVWEEVAKIEVNAPDLPGVMIDVGQSRRYPHAAAAAHLLGYVAAVSEAELTGEPLLALPEFRVGKGGIEKVHDLRLRGKAGASEVEVNAIGRAIRELARREGQPGDEVVLSIDMALQKFAYDRLGDESASVVVMDVHSGEVLALVSTPSFDPNAFTKGITTAYWRELTGNLRAPLTNKAVTGQYAPGSAIKMVVALAALEGGILTPDHKVFCKGYIQLGNARFHCWKKHGHGHTDMYKGIQQSCDVFFYDVARRTGVDRIAAMAERFGLGQLLDIGLPGERRGLIPTRDWKLANKGVPWQLGETLIAGIGQGFVLSTPLQLAVMAARLANGGRAVKPTLVRSVRRAGEGKTADTGAEPPDFPEIKIGKASLEFITGAMNAVTNTPRGTAYRARIKEPGMAMAGKTGTSQVRRISMSERQSGLIKNKQKPWIERDHAVFVGFAPVHDPRYAVAVVVEHGGGGSKVAAPIARDVLLETQRRDPSGVSGPQRFARG
ncbi:MAG: penicillin-binding protein 2 [Alphaproteobacteria bacterium]|nr:MAG: penicillin-binding protein 2 [Alphaproteobacteria bacterium]